MMSIVSTSGLLLGFGVNVTYTGIMASVVGHNRSTALYFVLIHPVFCVHALCMVCVHVHVCVWCGLCVGGIVCGFMGGV